MALIITIDDFKERQQWMQENRIKSCAHMWHKCHSQSCFRKSGRKSAVPKFHILLENRSRRRLKMCQSTRRKQKCESEKSYYNIVMNKLGPDLIATMICIQEMWHVKFLQDSNVDVEGWWGGKGGGSKAWL